MACIENTSCVCMVISKWYEDYVCKQLTCVRAERGESEFF